MLLKLIEKNNRWLLRRTSHCLDICHVKCQKNIKAKQRHAEEGQ